MYIIVFCMMAFGRVVAQNPDTLIYRSHSVRSLGAGFPSINYSFLSPLNHSGWSLGFHSTRFREKHNYIMQIQLHFELGLLYNNANDSYVTSIDFNSSWSRHWHVTNQSHPLRLMLGGSADMGVNVFLKEDNTNNPLAYFFNLSVSPSLLVKYRFSIRKTKLELGQQFDLPVSSLVSSSGYSSMLPYGFIEEDASIFDAMRVVSFGSLKKCMFATSLDVIPSLSRRYQWPTFRVSYLFSGMKYVHGDFSVKSVDHIILFGAIYYLFR